MGVDDNIKEKENVELHTEDNNKNDGWKVIERSQTKGKNVIKSIFIFTAVILVLGLVAWGGAKLYQSSLKPSQSKPSVQTEQQEITEETNQEFVEENNNTFSEVFDEYNKYIHQMANTIIIPVDKAKRGSTEITKETISIALSLVNDVDQYLYKEISKWKDGDFNNAVEVHNYVWSNLDGEIGKAKALDKEAINKIKENL